MYLKYSIFIPACIRKMFLACFHVVIKHPGEYIMYSTIIKYLTCPGTKKNAERLVKTYPKCQILTITTNHTYVNVPFVKLKCYHGAPLMRTQWVPVRNSLILIMVPIQKNYSDLSIVDSATSLPEIIYIQDKLVLILAVFLKIIGSYPTKVLIQWYMIIELGLQDINLKSCWKVMPFIPSLILLKPII